MIFRVEIEDKFMNTAYSVEGGSEAIVYSKEHVELFSKLGSSLSPLYPSVL